MNKLNIVTTLIYIALLFSSCAKAPQAEVDAANVSIEAAKTAGADRYAPESFNAASEALKTGVTAVEEQNSKFALFRNYNAAKTTLASVSTLSTKAADETTAKKTALKAEVTQATVDLGTLITANKELLAKAPKGKEGKAALEAVGQEIAVVETVNTEVTAGLANNEDVLTLSAKIKTVVKKAKALNTELTVGMSSVEGKMKQGEVIRKSNTQQQQREQQQWQQQQREQQQWQQQQQREQQQWQQQQQPQQQWQQQQQQQQQRLERPQQNAQPAQQQPDFAEPQKSDNNEESNPGRGKSNQDFSKATKIIGGPKQNLGSSTEPQRNYPGRDTTIRSATLGFSYYRMMPMEATRDFRINVVINGSGALVRSNIRKIEKEELEFIDQFVDKNDTSICVIKKINVFSKLKISLDYDPGDFTITTETEAEQVLDFNNGNNWHWKVRAVSKTPHIATIKLLINAETPYGIEYKIGEKRIDIKIVISLPESLWSKIWNGISKYINQILGLTITIVVTFYVTEAIKKKRIKGKNGGY